MGATFVMSYPAADWHVVAAQNPRAKAAAGPANPRAALKEWIALADAILYAQGRIVVLDPPAVAAAAVTATATPALSPTGLPYAADWGALIRRADQPVFLQSRGGAAHRVADTEPVRALFTGAGVEVQMLACAWGGRGDLIQVGPGRYVFLAGARTEAGAGAILGKELGNTVRYIEARVRPPFTFGDEVVTMLYNRAGDGVLLAHEGGLDGRSVPELRAAFNQVEVISVDADDAEAGACSALSVNGTVIIPPGLSTTLRGHMVRRGMQLVELEMPELFGRGGGGPRALVNELVGFVIGTGAPDYVHARDRIVGMLETYPDHAG